MIRIVLFNTIYADFLKKPESGNQSYTMALNLKNSFSPVGYALVLVVLVNCTLQVSVFPIIWIFFSILMRA